MNGVRSISMRKGYLLTALAAAVLLAASSGTAYAQSIGFSGSSATIMEGASPATTTPAPITVTINISGLTLEGDDANRETGLGTITLEHDADYGQDPGDGGTTTSRAIIGAFGWMARARLSMRAESAPSRTRARVTWKSTPRLLGKYGVSSGDFIPYDNNGVIRLVIIDPAATATGWTTSSPSRSSRRYCRLCQSGHLQRYGEGYRCAAGRYIQ